MAKPEGVRIRRGDTGEVVPVELIHLGIDENGMDQWKIADSTFRAGLDAIEMDVLPARTGIAIPGILPSWE